MIKLSYRIVGLIAAIATGAPLLDAATISYVGSDQYTGYSTWRDAALVKPLDLDGDNRYGSAGYVLYAADSNTVDSVAQQKAVAAINPLTFEQSYTVGSQTDTIKTESVIPAGISLSSLAQNRVDTWRFAQGDNADSSAAWTWGLAGYNGAAQGTVVDMLRFTFSESYSHLRIGIIAPPSNQAINGIGTVRLISDGQSADASAVSNVGANGSVFYFFDVIDANAGDQITLALARSTTGSATNIPYYGITFDAIPEPSTLAFLGGTLLTLPFLRRKKR